MKIKSSLLFTLLLVAFCASAFAQAEVQFDFYHPKFIPQPNNKGVKVERRYQVDPKTNQRTLVSSIEYDRNGYVVSPAFSNIFDSQGRLICHKEMLLRHSNGSPSLPENVVKSVQHIQYDAEGLVSFSVDTLFDDRNPDSVISINTYRQIGVERHPKYGITKLLYLQDFVYFNMLRDEVEDTLKIVRIYDDQGRTLRFGEDGSGVWPDLEMYSVSFGYDKEGRLAQQKSFLYEYFDSISYTYTATERIGSGKAYSEGYVAKIEQHATLDGIIKSSVYYWESEMPDWNDEPEEDFFNTYDSKSNLIRERNITHSDPPQVEITEYEYEYYPQFISQPNSNGAKEERCQQANSQTPDSGFAFFIVVKDDGTKETMQFVDVQVMKDGRQVAKSMTNLDGELLIAGLENGEYELVVSCVGYNKTTLAHCKPVPLKKAKKKKQAVEVLMTPPARMVDIEVK